MERVAAKSHRRLQLDSPLYHDAPLVTSIASQLLAAVVLSTFPHSGLAEPNP